MTGVQTCALPICTHGISPKEIIWNSEGRKWLTEGWARYYEYNLMVEYGDITQESADNSIRYDEPTNNFKWDVYEGNNYLDGYGEEIQWSYGYSITAWMFTMLRNDYNLNWGKFYSLYASNSETIDEAWNRGVTELYDFDNVVLELFTRSSNATLSTFQYDGPSGPGWGVRNITANNWYADLVPSLSFDESLSYVSGNEITLDASVQNLGEVDLEGVSVRFYDEFSGEMNLVDEQFVNVSKGNSVEVVTSFSLIEIGNHNLYVFVDEDNLKIESNEGNNNA